MRERTPESVPVPDPTLLTTAGIKLSIDNLKELFLTKLEAAEKHAKAEFSEIHKLLISSEQKRLELKEDSAKALAAALAANKELFDQKNRCNEEASAKSESSFSKQIEGISREALAERLALSDRITALKERLDRGEGRDTQQTQSKGQQNWLIGASIAGLALLIAVISLFVH
jgi:hypothetical protein